MITRSEIAPGYRTIEHLSRTRRLDTYEVWSEERACSCVAKRLRPDRRGDERARAALIAEGRLLVELAHPHIVRGYELLREPEIVVIMETLDGETVAHLAARHPGGLPAADVAWLGLHLASALHYLHRHELLHLDVKAANVIADGGRAKLIDLSLARAPGAWRAGIGTWCNLAPEQARGGEIGRPADVWGLGTVLYEAATGEPLYRDEDSDEEGSDEEGSWTDAEESERASATSAGTATWDTGEQLAAGYPQLDGPAPSAARPGLPAALSAAIDACLASEPGDRPTLDELRARLAPLADG